MRLHTMRLVAVGPFAGEETIDFARLCAGGLFLFEGPTGVGKSTILDALTFALYGGLASASGDVARMRSDFAAPQVRPEVELEFSVRGERHRITRSPEYLRAKLRGSGVTREKSSVHLQRLRGDRWETVTHAKDEAGTIVGELVGLNREQFSQVVLLPQGEFATFLRAGDDERRNVLAKLFGTDFYQRIAEQLQARASAARAELAGAETELTGRIAAAVEAAGLTVEERATLDELPALDRVPILAELGEHLLGHAQRAEQAALRAETAEAAARVALATAETRVERVDRRSTLVARLEEAERERPDHRARVDRLAAAMRAEPVRPLVELAASCAEQTGIATAAAESAGVSESEVGSVEADERDRAGRELRRRADALAGLVEAERGLRQAAAQVEEELHLVAGLVSTRDRLATRAAQLPDELRTARGELQEAQSAVLRAVAAQAQLARAVERSSAAERLSVVDAELLGRRAEHRAARKELLAAQHEVELFEGQRQATVRGELAKLLVNGDPCLVCGSRDHPDPAGGAIGGITDEVVHEAARRRDEERVRETELQVAIARLEGERQSLATATAGGTAEDWGAQVAAARADVAATDALVQRLPGLQEQVGGLEAESAAVQTQRVTVAEQLAAAESQVDERLAELTRISLEVDSALSGHPTVASRVASMVREAELLDRQAGAIRAVVAARSEYDSVRRRAAEEARDVGFVDLDEACHAILPRAQRSDLEEAIAGWNANVAAASTQLAAPELAAVAGVDDQEARAEAGLARGLLAEASRVAGTAQREATVTARQHERFTSRMCEVSETASRLASVAEETAEIVTMDLYARGIAGSPRMTLVTYVLRHWFEKVVAAANVRLEAMSAGKYQLLRTDEGARRDARVGLGLAVLDRHTGRERSPATLSGGETFYTSLALALGLADVVVAEAGGAQLDTLFIDEGFGSLDADTLEDVMSVIDDLRGNGRVVGIVSHVPDLKERIAERLSVRRVRPDGPSRVEVIA